MSEALELFLELAALPTPRGEERAAADVVSRYLRELALEVDEDDAGAGVGGDRATCSPAAADGRRRRRRRADLPLRPPRHRAAGGPDRAGRRGRRRPERGRHDPRRGQQGRGRGDARGRRARSCARAGRTPGVELLFTPKEEVGLLGAYAFDHTRLRARVGYVYDQAAPIGQIVLGAPTQRSLHVRFHGRAGARGHGPGGGPLRDRGGGAGDRRPPARPPRRRDDRERRRRSRAARRGTSSPSGARSRRRRGRTTSGSSTTSCRRCSTRSRSPPQARRLRGRDADRGDLPRLPLPARRPARAARRGGARARPASSRRYALTGGGADANVFNARGLPCVNLANGMAEIHTPDEHIAVADLERMVEVTLALVEAARGAAVA